MSRILVVEDENVLRMTFTQFLEEEGYETVAAEDYAEAEDLLENGPFDVIVTDIILPKGSGVDLLRRVRELELTSLVIMITGQPDYNTAAKAVRLGAFDYLPKPVTGPALKRVVRQALDRKDLQEERDRLAAEMDRYRRDLEAIFNSVNEGIVTVDSEMVIAQVNQPAAAFLGVDPAKVAGLPFRDMMPGILDSMAGALDKTLKSQEPVVDERVELTPPGLGSRVAIVSTTPLVTEGRAPCGAVLTIRDVTRLTHLERVVENRQQYYNIVGKSTQMQDLFQLVKDLAETDSTALILGDSGTGKELFAAALHNTSTRSDQAFIRVNCAALSESILESELFGHVKGAFTGAVSDRVGRFEAADGGTILLDEIGDISPRLQLRLLRVLQEREFERVGDSKSIRVNVRVIASSNQDLEQKIRLGEFRQDLFYRLNVVRLQISPLRDRREDIPLLVDCFIRKFNQIIKREITSVSPEVTDIFMRYPWPGNVRELENCIERAFIVCRETVVQLRHLPPEIVHAVSGESPYLTGADGRSGHSVALLKDQVLRVLDETDWNVAKTARTLGVARNTLYEKMKVFGLQRPLS
jgi:PAS domain S-box-containing protein